MIVLHLVTINIVDEELTRLLENPDNFADFTFLGWLSTQNGNVIAITVFLAWIKLFKYLTFNRTMKQLTGTLTRVQIEEILMRWVQFHLFFQSAKDIAGFGVMFLVAFFSFALFGYIIFGPNVSRVTLFNIRNNLFFSRSRVLAHSQTLSSPCWESSWVTLISQAWGRPSHS